MSCVSLAGAIRDSDVARRGGCRGDFGVGEGEDHSGAGTHPEQFFADQECCNAEAGGFMLPDDGIGACQLETITRMLSYKYT